MGACVSSVLPVPPPMLPMHKSDWQFHDFNWEEEYYRFKPPFGLISAQYAYKILLPSHCTVQTAGTEEFLFTWTTGLDGNIYLDSCLTLEIK